MLLTKMCAQGWSSGGARSFCTTATDTHAMSRVWEAIGRKADSQWVATGVGGSMLASLGLIGSSLYYGCKEKFAMLESKVEAAEGRLETKIEAVESRLETKIEAVESRLDAKIEAVESRLEAKIDAVEAKIDNLTHIVLQSTAARSGHQAHMG